MTLFELLPELRKGRAAEYLVVDSEGTRYGAQVVFDDEHARYLGGLNGHHAARIFRRFARLKEHGWVDWEWTTSLQEVGWHRLDWRVVDLPADDRPGPEWRRRFPPKESET